eukprot:TRINITY_DN5910_c0_g2_i1.p2 TRINITY_DN5910_c0_g2~~TRINITY_DN5910_c0_g2_i1.p2  ORF type:complete len:241 (-),score=50.36 TRINITY_DN5910_c0_g2_i1:73-795(-)
MFQLQIFFKSRTLNIYILRYIQLLQNTVNLHKNKENIMGKSFPVLGFDVGATKVAVCLGKSDGTIIGKGRVDNNDRHPDEVLPEMVALGKKLIAEAGMTHEDVVAIGIGSPAPHDIPNGLITTPTNMKKWVNVPIRDYLKDHFNIETYMENDANAGALAEWFFGAGKKARNMLYLTMSTGIGGGLILNGHLLDGKSFLAGEAGHICIDMGGPHVLCVDTCLLYTSPSPRDLSTSRMPSSA